MERQQNNNNQYFLGRLCLLQRVFLKEQKRIIMYKLSLLFLLVISSCTNPNQVGIVKNTDMYSLKAEKLANMYFNNSYDVNYEFLSDSITLKLNNTVYVGLNEVIKRINFHHMVFSNMKIIKMETATFFLNDGSILTEQFVDLTIQSSLNYNNLFIRSVRQYKWQDNKVIEMSSIFDASSFAQEINNYHNSLTKYTDD